MASVFVLLEAFNRKEAAALGFFPCATASWRRRWDSNPRGIAAKLISSTSRYSSYISLFCFALNRLFSALTLVFDILTYFVLYVACGCLGNI